MLLQWVTSEEAMCPTRSSLQHYDQQPHDSKRHINNHLSRPHLLISSLPNPAEPVEIALLSGRKTKGELLDIQTIANLWTQLLCIQTQNGNFIRHDKWNREREGPQMCISQMNPEECTKLRRELKEAHPPVEEVVADLICSLPYASCNDETYKIAPCTMMPGHESDRELYSFGPTLPPHTMRLTDWWSGNSGMLILLDVLTGITTELKNYKPRNDGHPHGQVMTEWNGPKKPIEDLLHEWIENYLNMRWIPDGSMDVMDSEGRSMKFLKYKALFEEFNWPSAFLLPQTQAGHFRKRHVELKESDGSFRQPYSDMWYNLTRLSYNSDVASSSDDSPGTQRVRMLDDKIAEALRYEEDRVKDMAYATATGGEISEHYKAPRRLHDSTNSGSGWRIDIEAKDIMERFRDVVALHSEMGCVEDEYRPPHPSSKPKLEILEEMGRAMEAQYHRYLNPVEADREARMVGVLDEDDDSTSDFELDDEDEDDESSDSCTDSDEEADNDLDATALETDMDFDVEEIREHMANSQVTTSETQASSQTLRDNESV